MTSVLSQLSLVAGPEIQSRIILLSLMFELYLVFEVLFSSAMIAFMREGDFKKSLTLMPVLLLLAFFVFFLGRTIILKFLKV
jgi:hypothetical protein